MKEFIQVDEVAKVSKEDFLNKYKNPELPLLMRGMTEEWGAKEKWSLEYFESQAGDEMVKLYDSTPSKDKKLQHAAAQTMPLRKYFDLLRKGEKDLRMFFFNIIDQAPSLQKDFKYPEVGLSFFKRLPVMFVGGKGAKVQMHFDIDYADIFLCHFGGKKKFMLFSPEQTKLMYHVPYSFSALFDVDFENPDYEKYPALRELQGYETELNHGDILYIPPGWWHYVTYEDISYSMALRAFPRKLGNLYRMLRNIVWIRSIEGVMRKLRGQKWNDRNERLAVSRTNDYLKSIS